MLANAIFPSALTSLTSVAAASSGGGVTVDFDGSVLIQFVAFIILFLAIKPLLLDPFLKVIEEREKRTDGAKTEAREMDKRAGEIMQRYEAELEKVRKVATEEREKLRQDGQRLEAKMLEEARVEAARILDEGKERIAKEGESLRLELAQTSAQLASQLASRVLGREVQ